MSDKRESSAMENNHAMVEIGLRNPRPAVLAPTYHGEIGIPGRKGSIPLSGTTIPSNGTSDAPRPGTPCSAIGPEIQTRERWNKPRANTWRLAAIFFAFVVFGMNDASYGALVPYVCSSKLVPRSNPTCVITYTMCSLDRSRLPSLLPHHLPCLPRSILRLHSRRFLQRSFTPSFRKTRYCNYCPLLQNLCLRSHICTPTIPSRGRNSRIGRYGMWIVGRCMERLDWDDGSPK